MIKVVPYIQTIGTEKFKEFLTQPFNINMLLNDNDSNVTLFERWKHGEDINNWYRITNDDIILEFDAKYYTIKNNVNNTSSIVHVPMTINDFINDMIRFDVNIYWSDWIFNNFEPKDYLHKDEISNYYKELLTKMDKSHELI